jgi:hypothetical protein
MKNDIKLDDLQASVQDKNAFNSLQDYYLLVKAFLNYIDKHKPTRIVSPTHNHYIFYQYGNAHAHKITRPLNSRLFVEDSQKFEQMIKRFSFFLSDLKKLEGGIIGKKNVESFLASNEINKSVYTIQQAIGCIGDSFTNPNQARKRIGQLFEQIIKLVIKEIGLECESRTINLPIPNNPGYVMAYELDLVFSRNKAILASETSLIYPHETVGSVKTTSKDRLDKIFLDKYLLTKFLGRNIPVIAIFLHDVQRAKRGNSIFGINSTFKSNHFLGYTVALNKMDGVYYVDPLPEMATNKKLQDEISDFQQFLIKDIWKLSNSGS